LKYERFYSSREAVMKPSEVRELLRLTIEKDVISFGGGLPDPKLLPKGFELEGFFEYLSSVDEVAFQYGTTEGFPELREEVLNFMRSHSGISGDVDSIIITTGSQQALDISARLLLDRNDHVVVELPTYLAALQAFNLSEPRYVGVAVDDMGIRTDLLETKLKHLKSQNVQSKFIYTIPNFQNPSGVTMSEDRRRHLLELASRYDLLVIEDDPYRYISFDERPKTALKALDADGRVLYLSTFSKIIAPGLRVGWVVADKDLINKIALAKQGMDLCTSPLNQYLALWCLRNGLVEKRLKVISEAYKRKRDLMLKTLEDSMPKGVRWTRPAGGMFVFVWLPDGMDTKAMMRRAITEYRVAYVPGRSFFVDDSGKNTMRLNFTYANEPDIKEGIGRLGRLIEQELEQTLITNIPQA